MLLQLISKHKLEVTELSLSTVTDEFLRYIRQQGQTWDLEEASHFLVVAATLLDLKVVKLLPGAELEDEEDLALLEARDLLFARLMQYRAYKDVSGIFAQMMADAPTMLPRTVGLDPDLHGLLPDVVLGLGPDAFAALGALALDPQAGAGSGHRPRARPAGQRPRAEGDPVRAHQGHGEGPRSATSSRTLRTG
jgi:segregation and condensation protein A